MIRRLAIAIALVVAMNSSALLAESRRRARPIDSLFPEQLAALKDPCPRKCIWTSGRAGKSTAILTGFVDDALQNPGSVYFYFCLTGPHVEEIAWPHLRRLDTEYRIGGRLQWHKLRYVLPNGSWIRLFGFDRPLALDRFYGIKLKGVAFDEAAFCNVDLEELIEDTIAMRLLDQAASVYLMSIPGRVPRSLFDAIISGFERRENMSAVRSPTKPRWSVHSWTWRENPAMRELVQAELERMEAEDPDQLKLPRVRRNYFGERVDERGARVYAYSREKCIYLRVDEATGAEVSEWKLRPSSDRYVLGVDFGWDDSTAFSLNAWRQDSPLFVELESYKQAEMRMAAIAARIRMYRDFVEDDQYHNLTIVGDHAHKAYFQELVRRYDLPIKIAEKTNKLDWIEVANDDLTLGRAQFVDPDSSPHCAEQLKLNRKVLKSGKWVEQPGAPNDCCDAWLVAYREAYHYLHQEQPEEPKPGSREWFEREEQQMLEEIERQDEEMYG